MRFAGIEIPSTDGAKEEKYPVVFEHYRVPPDMEEGSIEEILNAIRHLMDEQSKIYHADTLKAKDAFVRGAIRDADDSFAYRVYICTECGFVQRKVDDSFLMEINERLSALNR